MFFDGNERTTENKTLMKAKQSSGQKVINYATWIKNKATRAHVTNQKILGDIFFHGLLPEIIMAGKQEIPAEGFTLEGAIEFATTAERTLNSLKTVLDSQLEKQKKKSSSTLAALPVHDDDSDEQPFKKNKKKKGKKTRFLEKRNPAVFSWFYAKHRVLSLSHTQ